MNERADAGDARVNLRVLQKFLMSALAQFGGKLFDKWRR
jgi:hypothetical protein